MTLGIGAMIHMLGAGDRLAYWVGDNIGWILSGLLALFVFALVMGIRSEMRMERRFMAECTLDHKHYECQTMWRAGQPDVVPVPIIIPVR